MTGYAKAEPVPNQAGVWYKVDIDYCPVCGRERTERTRMPPPKPVDLSEVYDIKERYDWCDV